MRGHGGFLSVTLVPMRGAGTPLRTLRVSCPGAPFRMPRHKERDSP